MMKTLAKALMGLVLGLSLVTLVQGPAQAYTCASWDPLHYVCGLYTVDLLPNASWCGANPSPAANQVILYTMVNYQAPGASDNTYYPYCQIITVGVSNQNVPVLANYNMNGPTHYIASFWMGTNVQGVFYSAANYTGFTQTIGYGGYNNDTNYYWGYYPASYSFHKKSGT